MGHLYSDESIFELYDFAVNKMNLKPYWNHYSVFFPHFDLFGKKKKEAINLGAIFVNARDDIERYRQVKKLYKKFHEKNKHLDYLYESKGLMGQKILRIDFSKFKHQMNTLY